MFYYSNHKIKVLSHGAARAVNELTELARNFIYEGFEGDWETLNRQVKASIPVLTASQRGFLSSSGLDLENAISLALRTLKAEHTLILAQALAETTQTIAELCWYHRTNLKYLAMHLKIGEDEVCAIRDSDEYLAAVEGLIHTTRSPAEIVEWIETYPRSEMPLRFGKRMGLPETVVSQLIEKVLAECHTQTTCPGNIPQLRDTVQTDVALTTTHKIEPKDVSGTHPGLAEALMSVWQTLPSETQDAIWQTLPVETQHTLLHELSKQIEKVRNNLPLSNIPQTIEEGESLNIENMNHHQILRAVVHKRIQQYTSLREAAASLGIDTRTLQKYAHWKEPDE